MNDLITINLNGQPRFWDAPPIPERLKCEFKLYIDPLRNRDSVIINLLEYGIWEAWETVLILDILKGSNGNRIMIDFGCHIGYYSMMAAVMGYLVHAFDESIGSMRYTKISAKENGVDENVRLHFGRIDATSEKIEQVNYRLVKCDLEGNDFFAVKMLEDSFRAKQIDYAVVEISPCFNDSYPEMIKWICDFGYNSYLIPDKAFKNRIEYGNDPLGTIIKQGATTKINFNQRNFLFVKQPQGK